MEDRAESVQFYNSLKRPILILSSSAGRGNISIAEAIREYFDPVDDVYHAPIEDFMPAEIVVEDLVRYKFISNHFPFVLAAIYTVPLFYLRKLLREKRRVTCLPVLKDFLERQRIATVVCVSHRQAFWTTVLKRNESLEVAAYGVLTEFGANLGWKYIFWDEMSGFIAPPNVPIQRMGIPDAVSTRYLPLPARSAYYALAGATEAKCHCLLMGGLFGQGRMMHTLRLLAAHFPDVHVHVVCGDNARLECRIRKRFVHTSNVTIYGPLDSVAAILTKCRCVITKPGMGTLLEAHASGRKVFLFWGMPVAESNNARYAMRYFGAEWFSVAAFSKWLTTTTN